MSLKLYSTYSNIMPYVAHQINSSVGILPVPISVMNPAFAAPTTIYNILQERFELSVDATGKLVSINSFAPVQGFTLFLQGAALDESASLYTTIMPPGGFLEVVARKN